MLHAIQLVTGVMLRVIRELPQATQGVSEEFDWLDGHEYIRIDINGK